MSKYSEALKDIVDNTNINPLYYSVDTIKEAIQKAEKYDEVEPYIPTIKEHDIRDYVLYLQGKIGGLLEDNKTLTKLVWLKYGTSLNDKTTESLLDKYEEECHHMFAEKEKTLVENQILKEGIKTLLEHYGLDYIKEPIKDFNKFLQERSDEEIKEQENNINYIWLNKIKAMLEVIEDERKDKSIHKKDI